MLGRKHVRGWEAAVEIIGDCLRFEEYEIAVAQHRHFAEWMDGKDLRRAQGSFRQHVLYPLLFADHAHNTRVGRPDGTDDLRFRHSACPALIFASLIVYHEWHCGPGRNGTNGNAIVFPLLRRPALRPDVSLFRQDFGKGRESGPGHLRRLGDVSTTSGFPPITAEKSGHSGLAAAQNEPSFTLIRSGSVPKAIEFFL